MRVIAGELGGRRLISPRDEAVRPTGDRVREALFSILGELDDCEVLDLFAGTGALAIEALSRGAGAATLVDTDVRPAEDNVEALQLDDRCTVIRSDVIEFLERDHGCYDLILCDPPYKLARRFASELDMLIPERLREDGRVIVETAKSDPIDLQLPLIDERIYGATMIRIHGAG